MCVVVFKSGAKHLQLLSGVNPMAYWFGNFFFDLTIFLIIDVSSLITVAVIYPAVYMSEGRWVVTLTTVLLYSLTILPYIYCVQWIFKSPSNGVSFIIVINITLGKHTDMLSCRS
ncbi:unnamed protein product [Lymnaea stagnalis]|uniref:ABC-2 type transporter transmembrane domain-containing protein n=1 Tax=Lymnaea stagnalis TaxID=6523 RepID=A0AAV2IHQ3_LYMST